MKINVKFLLAASVAFVIGAGINNLAISQMPGSVNIAVVDVQQVVASSSQVNALKNENQAKATEIVKYIENARKEVAKVTDADKKKALEEKYAKELNSKREAYAQQYNTKMMDIQNNILNAVREQALADNYDLVIAKDVVLYGGNDITPALQKKVSAIPSTQAKKKK